VADATAHASLEYWPYGKASKHAWRTRAGQVVMSSVGYIGEAGLYALDTCREANHTLWWVQPTHRKLMHALCSLPPTYGHRRGLRRLVFTTRNTPSVQTECHRRSLVFPSEQAGE
jgi:hypothetical protein